MMKRSHQGQERLVSRQVERSDEMRRVAMIGLRRACRD
jgi:hypothetical protein